MAITRTIWRSTRTETQTFIELRLGSRAIIAPLSWLRLIENTTFLPSTLPDTMSSPVPAAPSRNLPR